jgi:hypothetical protein
MYVVDYKKGLLTFSKTIENSLSIYPYNRYGQRRPNLKTRMFDTINVLF